MKDYVYKVIPKDRQAGGCRHEMNVKPSVCDEFAQLPDEELCLMLEEETAWMFNLPPHEEPHPAPFVGDELFALLTEIAKRLRRYSKQSKIL